MKHVTSRISGASSKLNALLYVFIYVFIFWHFFVFHHKNCFFTIFISFFDEVSDLRNRILTNQNRNWWCKIVSGTVCLRRKLCFSNMSSYRDYCVGYHCVKSVQYGVFSGPYFPAFGLNTGKHGPKKAPYLDTFRTFLGLQVTEESKSSWKLDQSKSISIHCTKNEVFH